MDLSPKSALIIRDGVEKSVPASEVRVGDIFLLRPGSAAAVDGVVVEGECSVDEAALTGESVPRDKTVGDNIYAATKNTSEKLLTNL
jgi:Cu2+-exporting ATPase